MKTEEITQCDCGQYLEGYTNNDDCPRCGQPLDLTNK